MKAILVDIGRHVFRFGILSASNRIEKPERVNAPSDRKTSELGTERTATPLIEAVNGYAAKHGLDPSCMIVALAAPGPFRGERFHPMHLGKSDEVTWEFDAAHLRQALSQKLIVVHDVLAGAKSISVMPPEAFARIGDDREPDHRALFDNRARKPIAYIQTGVGLGVSALLPTADNQWLPFSGEGGSATIAPLNETEDRLFTALRANASEQGEFAAAQYLLSTRRLPDIYRALGGKEDRATPEAISEGIPSCAICHATVDAFAAWLGSFSADVVMMFAAMEGVYIAGPIPETFTADHHRTFAQRFRRRGKASDQLRFVPTIRIKDEYNALHGLAAFISELESETSV